MMEWFVYFEPTAKQYSVWQSNTAHPDDDTLVSARSIPKKVAYEIAALPDLLAVVESLTQHDTRNASQSLHELALRAKEAIAKAKGGA